MNIVGSFYFDSQQLSVTDKHGLHKNPFIMEVIRYLTSYVYFLGVVSYDVSELITGSFRDKIRSIWE